VRLSVLDLRLSVPVLPLRLSVLVAGDGCVEAGDGLADDSDDSGRSCLKKTWSGAPRTLAWLLQDSTEGPMSSDRELAPRSSELRASEMLLSGAAISRSVPCFTRSLDVWASVWSEELSGEEV